ncbi:hypothetical protein C0Q70_07676 [Pomacea canaliculata]|uniref:Reverse transcriptase domain-containing protein n=1 Tax=Pomacea canaliculata TaxID=400727 RepID=A0A2T7PFP0_POMCA|nr:hypothetical protein C0Q70_07676 [Pomacea canaliculata]
MWGGASSDTRGEMLGSFFMENDLCILNDGSNTFCRPHNSTESAIDLTHGLTWYLESQSLLSNLQCGFRKRRSTLDHLVRFETFVRDAFVGKEHVLGVFFDLERAYDTTWKRGILLDLHALGFRGRMPLFIENFLSHRHFQVRVGPILSDPQEQEMGVPQGSILSPTIFNIKIDSILKSVCPGLEASLYVDDFTICIPGRSLPCLERRLQLCVNAVQKWVTENGFNFSPTKSVCIHFCKLRGMFPNPSITVKGTILKVVQEVKFLGVIFDRKLSFLPHIKSLRLSCQKALDILRVVGHVSWGADRTVLLRLYRALIRSKLDYGSIIYGSARESYLKILDPIHHQGLRICLGAFRTTPVQSLYAEAGEPPLSLCRLKLMLSYACRLKSHPGNPAYRAVFRPQRAAQYAIRTKEQKPLSLQVAPHLQAAGVDIKQVEPLPPQTSPPWTLPVPEIRFDLTTFKKGNTSDPIYLQHFRKLISDYPQFCLIFTDGSKIPSGGPVAAAAVPSCQPQQAASVRLADESTIFTAELYAIMLALQHAHRSSEHNFLIISDSLFALQALISNESDHPLVVKIHKIHAALIERNKDIVFIWAPGHSGIPGNVRADQAAKAACQSPATAFCCPIESQRLRNGFFSPFVGEKIPTV